MWRTLFRSLKASLKNLGYYSLGLVVFCLFPIYIVVSLPVFFYRWLVCGVLSKCRSRPGKAVTVFSSVSAVELSKAQFRDRPRCAIISNMGFEGTVSFEEFRVAVQRLCSTKGGTAYPELQQYIETWMGYLFWSQDEAFNLDNHLTHHDCPPSWSEAECEDFHRSLVEELLNKPFAKGRSPWEIHLVNGYRSSDPKGKVMTIAVVRIHHCLADGFGMLATLCEGLFGISLSECGVPVPSRPKTRNPKLSKLLMCLALPLRMARDLGYMAAMSRDPIRTPWFIPEGERTYRQLYDRSGRIPLSKIKFVKNKFRVTFTSVLLAAIAAGIASSFKSKGFCSQVKRLHFATAVPLPDHPKKLRNHSSVAFLDLPIDPTLGPLGRLQKAEKYFQQGKRSSFPLLAQALVKLFGAQLPLISKLINTNRLLSTALSNFPGTGVKLNPHGWNMISQDFAAGLLFGVGGVGFFTGSYCDHIRLTVVAENAAMDRIELRGLIETIQSEINTLYELAMEGGGDEIGKMKEEIV